MQAKHKAHMEELQCWGPFPLLAPKAWRPTCLFWLLWSL